MKVEVFKFLLLGADSLLILQLLFGLLQKSAFFFFWMLKNNNSNNKCIVYGENLHFWVLFYPLIVWISCIICNCKWVFVFVLWVLLDWRFSLYYPLFFFVLAVFLVDLLVNFMFTICCYKWGSIGYVMSGLLEKLGCSALECRSSLVLICNFKWVNLNCVAIDCLGNLGVLLIVWELIYFGNLEAIVYILSVTIVIIIIKQ